MAAWKKGTSGNPAGRPPKGGQSIIEWANCLLRQDRDGIGKYSVQDVLDVLAAPPADKTEPISKRLACRLIKEGLEGTTVGLKFLQELIDRLEGRVGVRVQVSADVQLTKRVILELGDPDDRKRVLNMIDQPKQLTESEAVSSAKSKE